jgi:hypothetical protein
MNAIKWARHTRIVWYKRVRACCGPEGSRLHYHCNGMGVLALHNMQRKRGVCHAGGQSCMENTYDTGQCYHEVNDTVHRRMCVRKSKCNAITTQAL